RSPRRLVSSIGADEPDNGIDPGRCRDSAKGDDEQRPTQHARRVSAGWKRDRKRSQADGQRSPENQPKPDRADEPWVDMDEDVDWPQGEVCLSRVGYSEWRGRKVRRGRLPVEDVTTQSEPAAQRGRDEADDQDADTEGAKLHRG